MKMLEISDGWCELLEFWDARNNKPIKVMVCFDDDDEIVRNYEISRLVKQYEKEGFSLIGANVSGAVKKIILFTN